MTKIVSLVPLKRCHYPKLLKILDLWEWFFGIDLATGFKIKVKPLPFAAIGRYAFSAYSPKINRSIKNVSKMLLKPKGRKMGLCRSGAITPFALLISGTVPNGTPLRMPSIESWWYKDPMLWIVLLILVGIIVLKARQNK